MENNINNEENKKSSNSKLIVTILAIVVALLLCIAAFLFIQLRNQKIEYQVIYKEKTESTSEKTTLKRTLDSLIEEHNKIRAKYGELSDKLALKDSLIQKNVREIQQLLGSATELKKIKRKMDQLRNIAQGYVRQMDSLYVVNKHLTEENIKVKSDFQSEKSKNEELTKVKEDLSTKVNTASTLVAFKVSGFGIKIRGKKEDVVTKCRKVEQIKVSFTLLQNSLAKAGKKDFYVRIAGPDQKVLCDAVDNSSNLFEYKGEKIAFTMKKQVTYDNKNTDVDLTWPKKGDLTPGFYNVDVFNDGVQIGSGVFKLE